MWKKLTVHGDLLPQGIRGHTVTLLRDDKILFFGGSGNEQKEACYSSVYIFNPATLYMTRARCFGSIPEPVRAHSSAIVGQKIYVFGGGLNLLSLMKCNK